MSAPEFSDETLVAYVQFVYGASMAIRAEEIFAIDPENESGFARSIRGSLTAEIRRAADEARSALARRTWAEARATDPGHTA